MVEVEAARQYEADSSSVNESAPSQADVVIVGGGVAGCSLLYQLAKLGVTNTVLVEKDQLTAGTTWHTAGLLWRLRPSDTEIEIISSTHALMTSIEAESGVNPGWINNGGLFVASNKERMDEYKRLYTMGKVCGIESHVLNPEETKKLYPLMNVDDIYATLYSPLDGTIDPAGYCTGLTRVASRAGAKVVQNCGVQGIQTYVDDYGTKRVKAVETDRGTIQTNTVVNCAGVWSPYLGAMAGVNVPLIAMRHAYIVTERIEGIQNMPNVRDHDASVYLRLQGDSLQVGGYENNPIFWDKVDKEFAFSLFELDWDVFSSNIGGAINRVPVIENTGVKSTVCGPESFTADHKPLLGESPEVRGFYLSCGFNSSGMMLSGVSREVAKWIVNGRPDIDLFGYDIRRFTTKLTDNQVWIKQRSHEAYAKNYSILFPHDEPLGSRNMRKDALHEVLSAAGCVFQERQGWERPGWFNTTGPAVPMQYDYYGEYEYKANEDHRYQKMLNQDYTFDFPEHHEQIKNECLTCREKAAVFNMSYFGKYYLTGPDAQKAADGLFTNDMRKAPGSTVYTCMLNKRGGTEADLTVSVVEPGADGKQPFQPKFEGRGFYLAVGGGSSQHSFSFIMNALQDNHWDCQLIDHSEDMALISIQGPNSRSILQSLTTADLSNKAFPFSTHQVIEVAGKKLRALRLSFVGELGWELHVPNEEAVHVHNALMEAGNKHGGIVNAGYRAIDSLSIEKGYRHWHADLRSDDTPLESNLGFTCKLASDVDFNGRAALEEQKKSTLKKKIACFTLQQSVPLLGLEAIWRNEEVVGFLRRGEYAFALGKPIGYGYVVDEDGVTADYLRSGDYFVERMGTKYKADIHLRTPFDPKHKRLQGIYD